MKTPAPEKLLADDLSSTSPRTVTKLAQPLNSPPLDDQSTADGSSQHNISVPGLTGADMQTSIWATSVEPRFPQGNSSNPAAAKSKSAVLRKTVIRRRKIKSKQFVASSSGSDNDYVDDDSNSDTSFSPDFGKFS